MSITWWIVSIMALSRTSRKPNSHTHHTNFGHDFLQSHENLSIFASSEAETCAAWPVFQFQNSRYRKVEGLRDVWFSKIAEDDKICSLTSFCLLFVCCFISYDRSVWNSIFLLLLIWLLSYISHSLLFPCLSLFLERALEYFIRQKHILLVYRLTLHVIWSTLLISLPVVL